MVIVMKKNATEDQINRVLEWIAAVGYRPHVSAGVERTIIGAIGDGRGKEYLRNVELMSGVEKVMPILKPYKLASREFKQDDTVIKVHEVTIGGGTFTIMAGPCAVESM
ncbi:MAG: 3-deoxy-7-phosphoheptulonate synthase, partial [Syntrophales bacterium]|nr:3-deoxy-7-phosphoheptulonate synthase [Syntrophales bacterium]